MCRSEPQMFADVIRTRTSVGPSIRAPGTSLTLTCRGPSYTTAFMLPHRMPSHWPELVLPCQAAAPGDGYWQTCPYRCGDTTAHVQTSVFSGCARSPMGTGI